MRLYKILETVPDVDRNLVNYLARKGYIRPTKIKCDKRFFHEYTDDDLKTISAMSTYIAAGISPAKAYEKVRAQASDWRASYESILVTGVQNVSAGIREGILLAKSYGRENLNQILEDFARQSKNADANDVIKYISKRINEGLE